MYRSKNIIMLAIVVVMLMVTWAFASAAIVNDQKSVLSGTVIANSLVSVGAVVREGDVLVVVDTITGPAPAVRANVDGKVTEVLVKPGDIIKTGNAVVRIEQADK
ncbi:MAG: hypothetical protein H6Q74_797 [Firmicutes bacterium]|nr:hypothetical protein [Bacillota bacterium]